jgi:hypothetical protein
MPLGLGWIRARSGDGAPLVSNWAVRALAGEPIRRWLFDFVYGSVEPAGRDAATEAAVSRTLAASHLDKPGGAASGPKVSEDV